MIARRAVEHDELLLADVVEADATLWREAVRRRDHEDQLFVVQTSMLADVEAGRPLELDPLVSAVIEIAELVGVEVPRLRAIYAATKLSSRAC